MLAATGVRVRRGQRVIVENCDLTVHSGQIVVLTGASGAGKTSLLQCLCGLLSPEAGRVERATERVGVQFQEPRLLPWRTVIDNVALPVLWRGQTAGHGPAADRGRAIGDGTRSHGSVDAREVRSAAEALLNWLGITGVDQLPAELSGGMQRRVAVARALLAGTGLLFLDEPFAHLDPVSANRVEEAIVEQARSGAAVVLTNHENGMLSTVKVTEYAV